MITNATNMLYIYQKIEYFYAFRIDCFVKRQPVDRDVAMEINGCYWHGCHRCYPIDHTIIANGETGRAFEEEMLRELLNWKRKWK